jgi:pimeloyl-ACP methyl ester carboxylesterase
MRLSDQAEIYYKDWGKGRPVVFSHGWPLNANAWDEQIVFLAARGFRCIAHDRRGHGRSRQPWDGNDLDRYADDLAELIEALDVRDAILISHSTGGGEVTRYIGRHGTQRVAKAVPMSAIPPLMLKTAANPDGLSETDLTEDLKRIDVPTLIIHGDDDQIVPIGGFRAAVAEDRSWRDTPGLSQGAARADGNAQGPAPFGPAGLYPKRGRIARHMLPQELLGGSRCATYDDTYPAASSAPAAWAARRSPRPAHG